MPLTFDQARDVLQQLAPSAWKLDLGRMERLCALAEHPERRFRSVLVGGSAGKGSTCAFLAAILQATGRTIGAAPKPHLWTPCERVQINGTWISEAEFAQHVEQMVPWLETVSRVEGRPTVFEGLTLLAFRHFAACKVEHAVVEVGLGGRFDATNVLQPEVSVLTMIGLDHTDRLGMTHAAIAGEKCGILRSRRPAITGAEGEGLRVIEAEAARLGSPLWRLGHEVRVTLLQLTPTTTSFSVDTPLGTLEHLTSQLVGEHQARNAALAVAAAQQLAREEQAGGSVVSRDYPITVDTIRAGVRSARLPGRLQTVGHSPHILVDAAHSPDRALALAAALEALYLPRTPRMILVLGCSSGHAPLEIVERLAPLAAQVIATQSRHPAAIPPEHLADAARRAGAPVEVVIPVPEAIRAALARAGTADLVLVTGSLFVVGEAMEALKYRPDPRGS